MRRSVFSIAVGIAATALVAATELGAAAATSSPTTSAVATTKCQAIDAPTAMNDLPASADCNLSAPKAGGIRTTVASPLANPVNPTTPIQSTPLPFDRTNGDILAITKIDGTNDLAFGGNFSLVYTPDGVSHSAVDFAIVDEATGALLYGGNPSNGGSSDKYVRSIATVNGVVYVGGDFTSWDGAGRSHAARLAPTGNPAPAEYAVTSWNPAPGAMVRGLAVDSSAVYLGIGGTSVRAVNPTTGSTIWSKSVSGGDIHVVFEDQGFLFVGGLFETYDGVTQHGLVKVQLTDGSLVTAFNAHLRADTGVGRYGSYDGEEIISAAPGPNSSQIFFGSGGHAPAGLSANEPMLLNITTGARFWSYSTTGDCQAIGAVGDTAVAGYHNNGPNAGNPLSANYFGIQLEDSNAAPTTWDPRVNGNQGNADGGNNGVQAIYVDQSTQTLYLAGAFLHWNGTTGSNHQSLIAFSFAPVTAAAPGAPTGVSATAGDTSATVSWTAPASNGSAITGYTVTSSPDGITATTSGATSVLVSGLTNNTAYTFTVVATNGVGPGPASDPSNSVTPIAPTAPDPPTGVTAVAGDASATVSWTPPVSNGGSPITGYTVTSSPEGITASTSGATSVSVPGLTNGTGYTFTVVAANAIGSSAASSPSNLVIPTAPTAPGAPTGATAVAGNASAAVSWTAPASNGSAITGYTVTSAPGGLTATTGGATSTTVLGLTNGTSYTFTVVATNGVGPGPASDPSNSVTPTASTTEVTNSAEGGSAGVSVTVANSGGASGDAFKLVAKGSGATLVYSGAAAAHGSLGYALTGSSGTATLLSWNGYSANSMAIRFYYNPGPSLPSKVLRLADIRNSSATAARVELSASNQLFIQNAAGATVTTFPHALQANTWYRIELAISVSTSSASINAAYYLGSATTPVDPAYATGTGNTGSANIAQVSIGSAASATWTGTSYFDDLAAESGSTVLIGP